MVSVMISKLFCKKLVAPILKQKCKSNCFVMSTVVSKTTLSLYVDVMNIHKYLATKTIPKFMIVNVQLYV